MDGNFHIKSAEPHDVPAIVELIKALASYEKLADQVIASEQDITESLFGSDPNAFALLAKSEAEYVGFALYFFNFSTFLGKPGLYLEDLYVKEEHRGRGVGFSLLAQLAKIACEKGCRRFEWSVLDWNTPAIEFYKSLGAEPLKEWTVHRMSGETLKKLASHAPNKYLVWNQMFGSVDMW